jgi:hypothetical protein
MAYYHRLVPHDQWFIGLGRKDPVTRSFFRIGDEIVICPRCRAVTRKDSWLYAHNRCTVCEMESDGFQELPTLTREALSDVAGVRIGVPVRRPHPAPPPFVGRPPAPLRDHPTPANVNNREGNGFATNFIRGLAAFSFLYFVYFYGLNPAVDTKIHNRRAPSQFMYISTQDAGSRVYLRPAPKREGGHLVFRHGDKVEVTGYSNDWAQVRHGKVVGYVSSNLLVTTPPAKRELRANQQTKRTNSISPKKKSDRETVSFYLGGYIGSQRHKDDMKKVSELLK